jgi:hypothetical protein
MVSKVLLFNEKYWLYCSDVRLKEGVYSGWVENGMWHLIYDTNTKLLECYRTAEEERLGWKPVTSWTGELTWMCYPEGFGYNKVIANAEERYKAGEEANISLEPIMMKTEEVYDEVPF